MKRSLTQDILKSFRTTGSAAVLTATTNLTPLKRSPGESGSCGRQSLESSESPFEEGTRHSGKKARTFKFNGEAQALQLLLSSNKAEQWDAEEFLACFQLAEEAKDEVFLSLVYRFKAISDTCDRNSAGKREVLAKVIATLKALGSSAEKIESRELKPEAPSTVDAEIELEEVQSNPRKSQRAIDLRAHVSKLYIRTLRELFSWDEKSAEMLAQMETEVKQLLHDMKRKIVVARAEVKGKQARVDETQMDLASVEASITDYIFGDLASSDSSASVDQGQMVSKCIDAITDPDPQMSSLLLKRKRKKVECAQAIVDLNASKRFADLADIGLAVLKYAVKLIFKRAQASHKRAEEYKSALKEKATRALMHNISTLFETLDVFISHQKERDENAEKRLQQKKEELEEHLRLYEDEAPSELKEIKKRIAEFEGIKKRSKDNLDHLATTQKDLWSEAVIAQEPTCAENNASQQESKMVCVLPSNVIQVLQQGILGILPKVADCDSSLEQTLRDILRLSEKHGKSKKVFPPSPSTKAFSAVVPPALATHDCNDLSETRSSQELALVAVRDTSHSSFDEDVDINVFHSSNTSSPSSSSSKGGCVIS